MSTPRKENVLCCFCGERYERWRWDSINCEKHTNLSGAIASGRLFERCCPFCGAKWREAYPLICFHEGMGLIVALEYRGYDFDSWMLRAQIAKNQRLICVKDQFALSEKVACMESGRDDRLVELCKEWSKNQPGFLSNSRRIWHYYYSAGNGKEEFVGSNSRDIVYREPFPDQIYRLLEEALAAEQNANPVNDSVEWAMTVLKDKLGQVVLDDTILN